MLPEDLCPVHMTLHLSFACFITISHGAPSTMTASEVKPERFADVQLSPFEDSTPLLDDVEALRAKAARDGFLFFRGLLDKQSVLNLRRDVLEAFSRNALKAGSSDLDGTLNLEHLNRIPEDAMRSDIGVSKDMYTELQQIPRFHRLPHHPSLVGVYEKLLGGEIFVHPRHIMRAITPHPVMVPTPPHQDFPLIQGTTETWTCWIPIGDCPVKSGPLTVLRGSNRNGCLPVDRARGAGSIAAQLCKEDDWVSGDFETGDVLTFSSLTVHRALPSQVTDRVRISLDVRYQRAGDIMEAKSLGNHADVPWEEIYRGWKADGDLMYYWEKGKPPLSDWDDSLIRPGGRRIC